VRHGERREAGQRTLRHARDGLAHLRLSRESCAAKIGSRLLAVNRKLKRLSGPSQVYGFGVDLRHAEIQRKRRCSPSAA